MGTRGPPRGECVLPQLLPLCNKPRFEVLDQFSICCFIVHFARLIEEASGFLRRLDLNLRSFFIRQNQFSAIRKRKFSIIPLCSAYTDGKFHLKFQINLYFLISIKVSVLIIGDVCSFVCSFIHQFVRLFVHSLVRSFVRNTFFC